MKKQDKWIERRIEKELLAGETLLWYEKPIPMRLAIMYPIRLVLGVLWFTAFIILMSSTFRVLAMRATVVLPIVLMIFIGIGVSISARPLSAFVKAGGTIYAATNRRIIIVKPGSVRSYSPQNIQFIERRNRGNNTGDIILGYDTESDSLTSSKQVFGFFGVRNIEQVEAMLLEKFRPHGTFRYSIGRLEDDDTDDFDRYDLDDDELTDQNF